MQPAFAAHFILEVLHGAGDERIRSLDPGVRQHLIEKPSGWPDKRLSGEIFFVARLLADQHEGRVARAFAGHRLGGVAVKRAARAPCSA